MASVIPSREAILLLRGALRTNAPKCAQRLRILARVPARRVATHTHSHHASAISVLPTVVDTNSVDYKENAKSMNELTGRLAELHSRFALGGPQKAREKHIARGKMLPREYVHPAGYCCSTDTMH
jgi:3-methylcrotonyl-CoA carboxylase beta subunit